VSWSARIIAAERHPQADKLQVCRVAIAGGETLQIVCGAANARAGLKTALARVGAKLPGGLDIKAAKLRGVESFGMLCSAKELGLADTSDGILELPTELDAGADLRARSARRRPDRTGRDAEPRRRDVGARHRARSRGADCGAAARAGVGARGGDRTTSATPCISMRPLRARGSRVA
jgi:tRNA-binding EMAP/Myf-like protein